MSEKKELQCKDCMNLKRVKKAGSEWWACPRVAGAKPSWPALPCFVRKDN